MDMKELKAAMKALDGKSVEIGWFESNRYNNGVPVASVAAWNELGTPDAKHPIPARPFMRKAIADGNSTIGERLKKDVPKMILGKLSPDQILGRVGLHYEAAIVESIKLGGWQANSAATIARKGFDSPLIASGLMWQSVSHVISTKE